MSDEKPEPFAEARISRSQDGSEEVIAVDLQGEELFDVDDFDEESMVQIANRLNAAVEQREAKLRDTTIIEAARVITDAMTERGWGGTALSELAERILKLPRAGGDYVPAAELRAEQEKVRQLLVGFDALEAGVERYSTHEMVAAFLEANGLKKPNKTNKTPLLVPDVWALTKAEVKRLCKMLDRPIVIAPVERERLLLDEEMAEVERVGLREFARQRFPFPRTAFIEGEIHNFDLSDGRTRSIGVATADIEPGQAVTVNIGNGTVSPAPQRPHDPARLRRLMEWGATAREAEDHIEERGGIRPIWALAERLVERGIDFDYRRLDSDREYYEAAQRAARTRGVLRAVQVLHDAT